MRLEYRREGIDGSDLPNVGAKFRVAAISFGGTRTVNSPAASSTARSRPNGSRLPPDEEIEIDLLTI
jgi:hypothetical protein